MAHRIAHVIVAEYGIAGGLLACGIIYATSLVMDRCGLWTALLNAIASPGNLASFCQIHFLPFL
jgi:hypothetical protein